MAIDTPVFELRETLMGKYGEDSKLIYDLADQVRFFRRRDTSVCAVLLRMLSCCSSSSPPTTISRIRRHTRITLDVLNHQHSSAGVPLSARAASPRDCATTVCTFPHPESHSDVSACAVTHSCRQGGELPSLRYDLMCSSIP